MRDGQSLPSYHSAQPGRTAKRTRVSLCAPYTEINTNQGRVEGTHQNVVASTMILTLPGNSDRRVNVSSMSIGLDPSSVLSSEITSSVSTPSRCHGGEPVDRKMPAAAACVSVGELRDADGLCVPRELRAMRMCEGFTDILT
jgi:hypothetical protein